MSIEYTHWVAYGFPTGRSDILDETEHVQLYRALEEEGLTVLIQGSNWNHDVQAFIADKRLVIGVPEGDINSIPKSIPIEVDWEENNKRSRALVNLIERAREFKDSGKIGWYCVSWCS